MVYKMTDEKAFTLEEGSTEFNVRQTIASLMHRHPFYGFLLQTMIWKETTGISTLATDGKRVYYNPKFFNGLDVQERNFAIAHEIFHCMVDTIGRKHDSRDHEYWNMASDFVINASLIKDQVGKFIKGCLYEQKYEGMSADEVYNDLVKNKAPKQDTLDTHMDMLPKDLGDDDSKGSKGDSKDGNGTGNKKAPGSGTSEEEIEKNLKEFKQKILEAYQFAKGAGDVPGSVQNIVEKLVTPKINWKTLLQTSIRSIFKSDVTWQRPNRRSIDPSFILPSMWFEDTIDICVSIDTSGSITEDMKIEFLSEIKGILKYYKTFKLSLWCFDTQVHAFKTYELNNLEEIGNYKLEGGGGTQIESNFDFMKEKKIKPKIFVCFTDGYNYSDNWGPSNYCETIWVIHSNPKCKVPFGRMATYEFDKK